MAARKVGMGNKSRKLCEIVISIVADCFWLYLKEKSRNLFVCVISILQQQQKKHFNECMLLVYNDICCHIKLSQGT